MSNWFSPVFSGEYQPKALHPEILDHLAQRIESGLWPMASKLRNRYEIVTKNDDALRFKSTNILTGINIGLNDVMLKIDREQGAVRFLVTYWTWTSYCVALSGSIGLVLLAVLVLTYIFSPNSEQIPAVALWMFGSMILFWGGIWPWLLTGLHKGPAKLCIERILDEANQDRSHSC